MDKDKVLDLARLARIELSEAEAEKLSKEFGAILNYVSEVKDITTGDGREPAELAVRNVLREDGEAHKPGLYTEGILSQAPAREGSYLKVKKIL